MHILAGYLWRGIFGQKHLGWPTVRGTLDTILAAPPPDTTTTKKKTLQINFATRTSQLRKQYATPFATLLAAQTD